MALLRISFGRQHRTSTKEEELPQAKQFAEDWDLTLRGKARGSSQEGEDLRGGRRPVRERVRGHHGRTAQRARTQGHKARLRIHLRPFSSASSGCRR
ncbi:MAG: hypothetical protein M5R42_21305 [Rhodocyclaceae bacterium]|nr:hypothetical protein [Rhodocyclaceae bacterium]